MRCVRFTVFVGFRIDIVVGTELRDLAKPNSVKTSTLVSLKSPESIGHLKWQKKIVTWDQSAGSHIDPRVKVGIKCLIDARAFWRIFVTSSIFLCDINQNCCLFFNVLKMPYDRRISSLMHRAMPMCGSDLYCLVFVLFVPGTEPFDLYALGSSVSFLWSNVASLLTTSRKEHIGSVNFLGVYDLITILRWKKLSTAGTNPILYASRVLIRTWEWIHLLHNILVPFPLLLQLPLVDKCCSEIHIPISVLIVSLH